jgi:hypothetical protein
MYYIYTNIHKNKASETLKHFFQQLYYCKNIYKMQDNLYMIDPIPCETVILFKHKQT